MKIGDLGIDERPGDPFALVGRHFTLLDPEPVSDLQGFFRCQVVFKIIAESSIFPLAATGFARVRRMIDPQHGEAFAIGQKAHGVPRKVDGLGIFSLGVPVSGLAVFAFAIGAKVVGLLLAVFGNFLVGPEMEAGVLRVTIEPDCPSLADESGAPVDKGATRGVVDSQLAGFLGKGGPIATMPGDLGALAAQYLTCLGEQHFFVLGEYILGAMPDVGGFFLAVRTRVTDAVEPEEQTPMVGELTVLGGFGRGVGEHGGAVHRIEDIVERLEGVVMVGRVALVVEILKNRSFFVHLHQVQLGQAFFGFPEPESRRRHHMIQGDRGGLNLLASLQRRKDEDQEFFHNGIIGLAPAGDLRWHHAT